MVAFTFDDGPDYWTRFILDVIDGTEDKLTFFVTYQAKSWLDGTIYEDSLRRAHSLGCEIGIHSKNHAYVYTASTGTDAHTVGIDAIMNRKGFAGHYGLERYEMIEAYNLGSQVPNEDFIKKALELHADVLLVSQTVTQKDVHIQNLTNLIELLEAEGLRDKFVVCCGGPRITHELAKELGFDAGFGAGKYADDVASFAVTEMVKRGMK